MVGKKICLAMSWPKPILDLMIGLFFFFLVIKQSIKSLVLNNFSLIF